MFGGVDENRGFEDSFGSSERTFYGDTLDLVASDIGPREFVLKEDGKLAAADIGGQHLFEDGEGNAGLVSQLRYGAAAGVEPLGCADFRAEFEVAAVVLPDFGAVAAVELGSAELFNPWVLVGRDCLRGELAADPVCFLSHDNAHAVAEGGQGGRAAAYAGSENGDIGVKVSGLGKSGWEQQEAGGGLLKEGAAVEHHMYRNAMRTGFRPSPPVPSVDMGSAYHGL